MLAPIALYPDALLAQILMAATYPLEVVEAARWSQANPNLKGDAALAGGQGQGLGRQREVAGRLPAGPGDDEQQARLDPEGRRRDDRASRPTSRPPIQRLRAKAASGGQPQDHAAADGVDTAAERRRAGRDAAAIVIQPTNPELIYVPYYNPDLGLRAVALSRLSAVYYPPASYGWGGAGMMVGGSALAWASGRRRDVRRLALGRRLGRRLGMGRLARLGPRQQLHHGQRQSRDHISANNFNGNRYRDGQLEPRSGASPRRALSRSRPSRERYNQAP